MNEATELVTPVLMPLATRKPRTPRTQKLDITTPMGMVALAIQQGAGIEQLNRLMDLQDRYEATEARKAFNEAFANFKAEAVQITKNITVTDGPLKGKKYADLFSVVAAVTPALSRFGLSTSWKITKDEPTWIEVTCILRHVQGHFEVVSMGGIPDIGGAKNAIQARASSTSYLERYTLMAATGLASSDMDKDGHGETSKAEQMPEAIFQAHIRRLEEANTIPELQTAFGTAYKEAKDKPTQDALMRLKDKRKAEIGGAK